MQNRPVVLNSLVSDLKRVEDWLTTNLGVSVEESGGRETPDPFSPPDELKILKHAIDRLRPLLWVYLNRQNEAYELTLKKKPASMRSLMEEALTISDRYVRKD